ncbi:MAG: hypothetical protein AMXMBFR64_53660 [Myxococcales bacterium]
MSKQRAARPFAVIGVLSLAIGALAGACAMEPPSHAPWPTLEQGGSSPKTGVEGGKGKIPVVDKNQGGGNTPQTKDAGGSEN